MASPDATLPARPNTTVTVTSYYVPTPSSSSNGPLLATPRTAKSFTAIAIGGALGGFALTCILGAVLLVVWKKRHPERWNSFGAAGLRRTRTDAENFPGWRRVTASRLQQRDSVAATESKIGDQDGLERASTLNVPSSRAAARRDSLHRLELGGAIPEGDQSPSSSPTSPRPSIPDFLLEYKAMIAANNAFDDSASMSEKDIGRGISPAGPSSPPPFPPPLPQRRPSEHSIYVPQPRQEVALASNDFASRRSSSERSRTSLFTLGIKSASAHGHSSSRPIRTPSPTQSRRTPSPTQHRRINSQGSVRVLSPTSWHGHGSLPSRAANSSWHGAFAGTQPARPLPPPPPQAYGGYQYQRPPTSWSGHQSSSSGGGSQRPLLQHPPSSSGPPRQSKGRRSSASEVPSPSKSSYSGPPKFFFQRSNTSLVQPQALPLPPTPPPPPLPLSPWMYPLPTPSPPESPLTPPRRLTVTNPDLTNSPTGSDLSLPAGVATPSGTPSRLSYVNIPHAA